MKKIIVILFMSLLMQGVGFGQSIANIQNPNNAKQYKRSFQISIFSAERYFVDNQVNYSHGRNVWRFRDLLVNIIPVSSSYQHSLHNNYGIYARLDIKPNYMPNALNSPDRLGDAYTYRRRYYVGDMGGFVSKKISNKHALYASLNAGVACRWGGEEAVINRFPQQQIYEDIGISIAPQISYYPFEHWGIELQGKYNVFSSDFSPELFLGTLSLSYRLNRFKLSSSNNNIKQ